MNAAFGVGPVALFVIATAIWGSTWLAIKFQLGEVAPEVSVAYRFALASVILAASCLALKRSLSFSARTHLFLAGQGATMFGINYVLIYVAERYVASGLVAVVFSTMVFMTPVGTRLAFGTPMAPRVIAGASLGVLGVALLFLPELAAVGDGGDAALGIAFAFIATLIASIGNLVTLRLQRIGVPVFSGTAWGMAYGAATAAIAAAVAGAVWTFDARWPYVASLAYLAVLGSVVAFVAYFVLIRQVGPGPASFLAVSTPVVAMFLSTFAEGYRWTPIAAVGVVLAVAGNVLALRSKNGNH
ncbi:MAG TPA: EamA family transporter [Casimicrobiaceae bacterium]|nr:EamA family transporter [Casimicrobiaceae bacterium]